MVPLYVVGLLYNLVQLFEPTAVSFPDQPFGSGPGLPLVGCSGQFTKDKVREQVQRYTPKAVLETFLSCSALLG